MMSEKDQAASKTDQDYQLMEDDQLAQEVFGDEQVEQQAQSPEKKSRFQKIAMLKNKRVVLVVGVVLMVIIVYNLLGGNDLTIPVRPTDDFTTTVQDSSPPPSPASQLSAENTLQAQLVDKKAVQLLEANKAAADDERAKSAEKPPLPPVPTVVQQGISRQELQNLFDGQLQRMQAQLISHYEDKLKNVENGNLVQQQNFTELKQELASLKTLLENLQGAIAKISQNQQRILYNQGMSFDATGESKDDGVDKSTNSAQTPKPHYRVQAAVPGRAWLKNDDGDTLSVAVGDNLPGYGIVVSIDGVEGYVLTSAGVTFGSR